MDVLLAGAAGFLGSHLSDRLISEGHRVIGVDNLSTGSLDNISHLSNEPAFEFIESNIEELSCSLPELDLIVHMASPASPRFFEIMPLEILSANSVGTLKLLEIAKEKSSRFLFASTSECYGDPEVHPQPESYNGNVSPVSIRGVYDESKRFGEALTMTYYRKYNTDIRIARIFNTYGPRMRSDDGRVIPNFISQTLEGRAITVYGDGFQTRSFCYVSDMVDGLMRLIGTKASQIYLPINLGNPQEIAIVDLAKKVIELVSSGADMVYKEIPEGDPRVRCPDITRAREILEWEPTINIEKGLLVIIKYYQNMLNKELTDTIF